MFTFLAGAVLTSLLIMAAVLVRDLWPLPVIAATHTPIVAFLLAGNIVIGNELRLVTIRPLGCEPVVRPAP